MADEDDAPQEAAAAGTGGEAIATVPAFVDGSSSPYTLDRINDIIDFESELIMLDRDRANRNAHYKTLRFFWQLHPARNVKTGRRYARFLIAQLLSTACNCEPYSRKIRSNKKMPAASAELNGQQQQQPLDQWSRQDWQSLQDDLQHLREVLIRQDAERNCDDATLEQQQHQPPPPQQQHAEEDALEAEAAAIAAAIATATRLNVKRAQSPAFSTKYDTITILLETQKALAPIRCQLEHFLHPKANQKEIESVISPEEMHDLFCYATSLTETRVSDLLLHLFEPVTAAAAVAAVTDESSAEQQGQTVLKSNRQELKDLLTTKAFDLAYLQEKLQTVLLRFNGEVYSKDVPVLLKLHYTFVTSGRNLDRRAKRASQELYKFIMETEQKPRARFTAIRSSTIKKKPPEASAASSAKKTKKKKKDMDELKKGGQAGKQEPTTTGGAAAGTAQGDLIFVTPASTTATPTDDARKGDTSSSKKRSLPHQPDLLDLFDMDDKDDADEAAKMSQGAKKSRVVANRGSGGRGGTSSSAASAAASVGISAATDDPNYHWDLPPPDDGIFDQMGKVLRRIKWSDEEKNAVKEGVRALGVGKWMDVKKKYPFILKNRTSVQIKDCYRTMSKNKEMETEGVFKNKEMETEGV